MKKLFLRAVGIVTLLFLTAGCGSLPGGGFSLSDMAGGAIASAVGLDDLSVELQAMEFYALYATYGFYGGLNYETGYSEGEGVRWVSLSADDEGQEQKTYFERVYLKDLGAGSGWWRLTVNNKDETAEYEYFLTEDSDFEVVRFKDADTGEIVEYRPEMEEASEEVAVEETEMTEEEAVYQEEYETMEEYENLEYSQYSMGEEKITVGAGTFTAEHMVSEYKDDTDPENTTDIRSDWWVSEAVPGGVLKYVWINRENGEELTSELDDILSGQTTRLDSF